MSSELNQQLTLEQILDNVRWNEAGLVSAIVQDDATLHVLTLAYMNRESLKLSLESGETWFWSRSRQELWHKGATSGNTQKISSIQLDCDGDALLVRVIPSGPACHTGATSCFSRDISVPGTAVAAGAGNAGAQILGTPTDAISSVSEGRFEVLAQLEAIIKEREETRPEGAYTTYLFDKGVDKILKKVGEEASETIIAAKNKDNEELRLEVSDLIYHLLVLLQERKLPLDDVLAELNRRHERPRRD
ncbi:phosphoribosyl-ATP pyrophosphohydrolase/phosphoribosyl-AMP cyclohydrolase [Paenibacillus jamilae]|jgi:phosphoribosyl-ATP pyrophosphohydrolase/phosphoribosyl-AMP cyclohydrolase|uniref:bifunctional phosphoribosyl-AMP cyclohydrolase/phosphoribosyl-ATP diphosphatase HisIE n=1 Tax=Paenibacillus polymyxa TaxID=1406 RepID=UPI00129A4258|nr:bifunctional phosphoribosyl-AMP cyclohydrolase/phosphoribosyl-ATP diphosphatase HisIE [Paenibacillus polymyxa]MDP9678607.1 phosphoribosyl-ATP pyrophosphohydrolase/phosphoribosyl-AMP cyclohydrolase [Paenibacillus jamilae]KAE8560917.1 bifunctional phosphoribosyl-AMP cyclohydrolase/phosphoribosyl-ATP pyrophosphatase [Paenibacillus polymyxa]MBY0023055.1 bifunctional phosphoribosyl-AMP cyclohydrolase/phosphoribosyl-ATP diphosphatase HisIE [Paenibacillus polymyxa]MBY0059713.1 bifunctional phosphor